MKYYNKPTYIRSSMSNILIFRCGKLHLCFTQKNISKKMVFNLKDIFILANSLSNFIKLTLLDNSKIYHNIKNKILYNINIKEVLVQAKRWNNNFLL